MGIDLEKDYENDIPKHKKKSDSKHQSRADHKHIYETGAIRIDTMVAGKPKRIICKGRICTLCGRVGELNFLWGNGNETQEEIWNSYPHYFMNNFTDKVATKEDEKAEFGELLPETGQTREAIEK